MRLAVVVVAGECAARGRAWIPPGTSLARCDAFLRCRFARLPCSSVPVSAIWSEQEAEARAKQWAAAQGYREHGLQAYE